MSDAENDNSGPFPDDGWRVLAPRPVSRLAPLATPPTFSVVMAAYQAEATVGDAVSSALDQTVPPMEVVVCDDGSTDGTAGVLADFGDRVRVVRQANAGEAAAKNAAVAAARGDFVVVLDADDLFTARRLEALGHLARQRPDLDVLTTDAVVEADGVAVRTAYHDGWTFEVEDQRAGILSRNFVLGLAAVRRETWLAAGGFDPTISRATDWDFWLRLVLAGSRIGLVAEPLARYRLTSGTLSSDRTRLVEARITVLSRAAARDDLSDHERRVVRSSLRRERAGLAGRVADDSLTSGGARRAHAWLLATPGVGARRRAGAAATILAPRLMARRRAARATGVEIGSGLRVPGAPRT